MLVWYTFIRLSFVNMGETLLGNLNLYRFFARIMHTYNLLILIYHVC